MSSPTAHQVEAIRAALETVVSSPGFRNSDRMVRFLRLIVEHALSGDGGGLKEYTLGVEVFDRDSAFDPKNDTIVRVEARRLRRKLEEYYQGPGAQARLRIEMPSPGYAVVFHFDPPVNSPAPDSPVPESPAPESSVQESSVPAPWPWTWVAAVALVILLAGAGWWWWSARNRPELTSVAVLPFANMSGDAKFDYFSDGFTEELIDRLSAIPNLRVAARTSSFEFKGRSLDIRQIAQRLNVDAVVEGSVRRAGDTVRITAQLIRASDGYHVWSRTWDRQGQGVLDVESEVASAIAEAYRLTLVPIRGAVPTLAAHDLYLVGRSHWHNLDPPELFQAIQYFQQAIALSPDYALAYSGLSEAYSYLIDMDIVPTREFAPKAKAAAEKALRLDDSLAEAHTSLGLVKMDAEWDFAGAGKSFARSLELRPRFAYGIHWQAHYFENLGREEEGCAEMRRASQIDPLDRVYQVDIAMCDYQRRRFAEALSQLQQVRQLDPKWPLFDLTEGLIQVGQGHAAEALAAAKRTESGIGPVPVAIVVRALSEALAGNAAGAREQLERLRVAARGGYVPAYALSLSAYAAGDQTEGYRWLRRAWDERNGTLVWLGRTPMFDLARQDPRGARLLARVGEVGYLPD